MIKKLYTHKLATQTLRDLLMQVGRPTTSVEVCILDDLSDAYRRMRGAFPTPQLRTDLDALYSKALSAAGGAASAMEVLKAELSPRLPDPDGQSMAQMTAESDRETLMLRSMASNGFDRDAEPIRRRIRQALFFSLADAVDVINAALNAAKKKKKG